MVTFTYARELVDAPSKLLVVMQGGLEDRVAQRFERLVEISQKTRVGVIDYLGFVGLLEEMGIVVRQPVRGSRNGLRCHKCELIYLTPKYKKCVLCGNALASWPKRSKREPRRYVDIGDDVLSTGIV